MLVREAEEQDLEDIVECHCSDVEKWHGLRDGKVVELRYEESTTYERCHFNCGEWLDRDVCRLHMHLLKEKNEEAFVAELKGKVVGEAEVCLAEEPLPYGRYAFLTTVMVHRNFRRMGIGLALVQRTIQWAQLRGYQAYDTIPENEISEGLYSKAGLEPIESFSQMRGDIEQLRWEPAKACLKELSIGDDPSESLLMIARHVDPSVHIWKNAFNQKLLLQFEGYEGRFHSPVAVQVSAKRLKGIVLLVPALYNPLKCFFHLYVEPKMAERMDVINLLICKGLELAQQNQFQILETSVQEHMLPVFRKIGFHQTQHKDLYMRLKIH